MSHKRSILAGEITICLEWAADSARSWFGVNRTILTKVSAERRILHFPSLWPSR